MMNLILCSGNSLRNRDWIQETEPKIRNGFDRTYIQMYKHWETGAELIDLDYELPLLAHAADTMDKYGVFAKSIGTVLTTQAIEKQLLKPKFLLFCGIPLGYLESGYRQFADVLAAANVPTSIIHNDQDTVGTSQAVQAYFDDAFSEHVNFRFTETAGDTHDYEQYDLINAELQRLTTSVS